MRSVVTLALDEATENQRLITIDSKRFTIGRSPDNDLMIDNASLSRRHAVIENFDGVIQLSDCGSQNGTLVNGSNVIGGVALQDRDVITLGGVFDLTVRIGNDSEQVSPSAVNPDPFQNYQTATAATEKAPTFTRAVPPRRAKPQVRNQPSRETWFSIPVLAGGAIVLILLVSGLLVLVLMNSNTGGDRRRSGQVDSTASPSQEVASTEPTNENSAVDTKDPSKGSSSSTSTESIENAAIQVMHRVSSDDKSYTFSDKALREIQQKVQDYSRSPNLTSALASLQRNSSSLAAMAHREGLEPGLLIYMALAQTDGGRAGDPVATARAILPDVLGLLATFGINNADSSLILVAAYKMGGGEKRSHPLLATMRRLVNNPLTQRNVWYLNEKGGLDQRSYDFVLSFLALGVISQNPHQFGVQADPLSF